MKYKTQYDNRAQPSQYKIGEWILIKHPQVETGANCKLSRPWYGLFELLEWRILESLRDIFMVTHQRIKLDSM